MKMISETVKGGKRRVVVELGPNEQLIAVDPSSHYQMAEPVDDIVVGRHIIGAKEVEWCAVEQGWVG
jgi:hypothetical protein